MIITKDFVVLNLPKTGTTFTRDILKILYGVKKNSLLKRILYKYDIITPKLIELKLPNIKMPNRIPDQHGTYSQIPNKYRNRKIVSTVRNPYSRFLSAYKFRAWANPNQLEVSKSIIEEHFPSFPNLTIDEYVDLNILGENTRLKKLCGKEISNINEIGNQTIQFIQMFFIDPSSAIEKINEDYIESGKYKKDMANIHFFKQETLNEDLKSFLFDYGFSEEQLKYINKTKKLNITNYKTKDVNDLWTSKAIDCVKYRERFLIKILSDLGIKYNQPKIY